MSAARPAAFSRIGAFLLVAGGAALFFAMLWLIGAGADFGGDRGRGQAHAASVGLNGYAGLTRLIEAQGYAVTLSRNPEGHRTRDLLVLTPGAYGDGEQIGKILAERRAIGPTLMILPKWWASAPPSDLPPEAQEKFKRGWVTIGDVTPSEWTAQLPGPYGFTHRAYPASASVSELIVIPGEPAPTPAPGPAPAPIGAPAPQTAEAPMSGQPARWQGMGLAGALPREEVLHADLRDGQQALIRDAAGRVLAFGVNLDQRRDSDAEAQKGATSFAPDRYPVIVLADPDLANNYGLADATRAAAAIALVDRLTLDGEIDRVSFDLTLNGFGASENLLTLAFRPPFLAATLSLLVALLIVGWRAFQRFGPAAVSAGPDIAFGKRQLIANGAGLILRARRFRLLAAPYAALAARRLAERLGLARPDPEAIDAALARRLPQEEPFTRRIARLQAARRPADILAAARGLNDLATKLQQGPK